MNIQFKVLLILILTSLVLVITYIDFSTQPSPKFVVPNFQQPPLHILNIPTSNLTTCPGIPPGLKGPLQIDLDIVVNATEESTKFHLQPGGGYMPSECKSAHHVAIIVPFRDREDHLQIFLHYLHPFLQRQQLNYRIFIVEQYGNSSFNRGKLFNVGFVESSKMSEFRCIVMHDVDLIPEDDRNLYTCPDEGRPRHLSVKLDIMNYKLPYATIFGGVSSMLVKDFKAINGYSNDFWGWGGEDDDLYNRIKNKGMKIIRYEGNITKYKGFKHKKQKPNPQRYKIMKRGRRTHFQNDGLTTLKYKLINRQFKSLYTWLYVDI